LAGSVCAVAIVEGGINAENIVSAIMAQQHLRKMIPIRIDFVCNYHGIARHTAQVACLGEEKLRSALDGVLARAHHKVVAVDHLGAPADPQDGHYIA
jgi:hypothetical protein